MGEVPILMPPAIVFFTLLKEQALEQVLTKFWEIEQVLKRPLIEPEEVECEKIYSKTCETIRVIQLRYLLKIL